MPYDHYKIRLAFKVIIAGYLLTMAFTFLLALTRTQPPAFVGFGIMAVGFIMMVLGLYLSWMILNVVLDTHAKVLSLLEKSSSGD